MQHEDPVVCLVAQLDVPGCAHEDLLGSGDLLPIDNHANHQITNLTLNVIMEVQVGFTDTFLVVLDPSLLGPLVSLVAQTFEFLEVPQIEDPGCGANQFLVIPDELARPEGQSLDLVPDFIDPTHVLGGAVPLGFHDHVPSGHGPSGDPGL